MPMHMGSCPKPPTLIPLAFVSAPHATWEGTVYYPVVRNNTLGLVQIAIRSPPSFPYSILTPSVSVKGKYWSPLVDKKRKAKT